MVNGAINAETMVKIVKENLEDAFPRSPYPRESRFLMDKCPQQKSKKAMQAYDRLNAKVFCIPTRSPDLNPIENFFHIIVQQLNEDAINNNITKETKEEFTERAKSTIRTREKINKIIDSMPKRIDEVIKSKRRRTKY